MKHVSKARREPTATIGILEEWMPRLRRIDERVLQPGDRPFTAGWHVRLHRRDLLGFGADRGPHLAAMIAYFGLLSSVSLIFLALAILDPAEPKSRAISSRSSSTSSRLRGSTTS